jgi:hypothetical protein
MISAILPVLAISLHAPNPDTCVAIERPLVQPVGASLKIKGLSSLGKGDSREVTEKVAADWLGITPRPGERLAPVLWNRAISELRRRKYRAEVERRDSWSQADEIELARMLDTPEGRGQFTAKPYLVRGVWIEGRVDAPLILVDICGDVLKVTAATLASSPPKTTPWPVVVFLSSRPKEVISSTVYDE